MVLELEEIILKFVPWPQHKLNLPCVEQLPEGQLAILNFFQYFP